MTADPPPPPPRRRWRRRLAVLAVLLLGLYLARVPLLRGLAGLLIVDEPDAAADTLVLLDGDGMTAEAARRYREGLARRVLLFDPTPSRVERMGLIPRRLDQLHHALCAAGVPDKAITVLPGAGRGTAQYLRALRRWLDEHPDDPVHLFCARFESRRVRLVVSRVLGAQASRVHLLALVPSGHDESNWWQQHGGQLDFVTQTVCLAATWACGERTIPRNDWDPDEYEDGLR